MVQQISDDEAVGRVRSGDTASYEVLAARYHRPLQRVARRLLRSEAEADDVVQAAHLLALTHLHQYGGSGYFRWMYSIVLNQARSEMRRTKRLTNVEDNCARQLSSPMRNPEQQALDQETEHVLESAVQVLPGIYRPVFRLREMQELTTAETGARLGLTEACVKTRLFRAKTILRKKLRRGDFTSSSD
jgi:RNA polymerase sigma-70 factor (ECF subfamily)